MKSDVKRQCLGRPRKVNDETPWTLRYVTPYFPRRDKDPYPDPPVVVDLHFHVCNLVIVKDEGTFGP